MKDFEQKQIQVLNGDMSLMDFIFEKYSDDTELKLTHKLYSVYWQMVKDEMSKGKKPVLVGGSIPLEPLYALDLIPINGDLLSLALSDCTHLKFKLIDSAELHLAENTCSINKIFIGIFNEQILGLSVKGFAYAPINCPCFDSSYDTVSQLLPQVPCFSFDIPRTKSPSSIEYLTTQVKSYITFLEQVAGKKLDFEKMKEYTERTDKAQHLFEDLAETRENIPCPISSHMQPLGALMTAMGCTDNMINLLQDEKKSANLIIEQGGSPSRTGEKHRVFLLQNKLWCNDNIIKMLEDNYGAVTVMDGFCNRKNEYCNNYCNKTILLETMCRRMMNPPLMHDTLIRSQELVDMTDNIIDIFNADTILFIGNYRCRNSWSSTNMISDSVSQEFGNSPLLLSVDSLDERYKSEFDIREEICQYMDLIINS